MRNETDIKFYHHIEIMEMQHAYRYEKFEKEAK